MPMLGREGELHGVTWEKQVLSHPSDPPHPHLPPDTGKPQEGNSFPGRAVGAGPARVRPGAGVTHGHRRVDTDMCLFGSLIGHGGVPVRDEGGREAVSSLTSKHPA